MMNNSVLVAESGVPTAKVVVEYAVLVARTVIVQKIAKHVACQIVRAGNSI